MNKKLNFIIYIIFLFTIIPFVSSFNVNIPTPINTSTYNVSDAQTLQGHPASYFYPASNPSAFISDGNTNWDNIYGFTTSTEQNGTYVTYENAVSNVNLGDKNFTTTGTITANKFIGDGSELTNLPSQIINIPTSLISWYRFDDGITTDYNGVNNLTNNNGVTLVDGVLGKGAEFDKDSSQYLSKSSPTNIPGGNSERTISFWFNADVFNTDPVNVNTGNMVTFTNASVGSGQVFTIIAEDGAVSVAFNGHRLITPKNELTASNWYYVTVRVPTGSTLTSDTQIFINGVQQSLSIEAGSAQTLDTIADVILLGKAHSGLNLYYDGKLDDVKIYNVALTDAEILREYQSKMPNSQIDTIYIEKYLTSPYGHFDRLTYNKINKITSETSITAGTSVIAGTSISAGTDISAMGNMYATDFITYSKVADVEGSSLSKLDNFTEWKDKDGNLIYKNHYAYVEIEKDGEIKQGLSMETRVAEMEKMIWELREENKLLKLRLDEIETETCSIKLFSWCIK